MHGSRRSFLAKAGAGTAVMAVGSTVLPIGLVLPPAWAQGLDDVAIAKFAESVELALVDAYVATAATGKIGADLVPILQAFAEHHAQHAAAFQAILGDAAGRRSNQAILAEFGPRIVAAVDQAALLEISFVLEQAMAATYVVDLGTLQDPANAAAVATILPVEAQHAVVLAQALSKEIDDYLPTLQSTDGALDAATYAIG